MKRAKYYVASAVGAALLAGAAGTAAMSQERTAAPEREGRPHHAMKHDGFKQGGFNQGSIQQDGKRWHGRHHHGYSRDRGAMHGGMFGLFGGRHTEGMLAFARTELEITEAQETEWEALATAVRNSSERMSALREEARAERTARTGSGDAEARTERQRPDVAQRLERMEALAEIRLETVREVNGAFQPLYASFSDEQKEKLSTLLRPRGRR